MLEGFVFALRIELPRSQMPAWRRHVLLDELDADEPGLLEIGRALGPAADVSDLLAHLLQEAEDGEQFIEVEVLAAEVHVRGVLSDWSDYHDHHPALLCALSAARHHQGLGFLTFLGDAGDPCMFARLAEGRVEITRTDSQNVGEDQWRERFGDLEAFDEAHRRWRKRARKR